MLIIQDGDKYAISKDMQGVCRLSIRFSELQDSGEYMCKIDKQEDKTVTTVEIKGMIKFSKFSTLK